MAGCDFLTITEANTSGVPLNVPVALGGADRSRDRVLGEVAETWDGSLRNTERIVKAGWQVTTPPMLPVDADALRSKVVPGQRYDVSGTIVGGTGAVECIVQITRESYVGSVAGVLTEFTLLIREA